jgi:hypothetical protein
VAEATVVTAATLQTAQRIAVVGQVLAEAHKAIHLTQVQEELVDRGLFMYDTPYKKLAPAIHLYNIGEASNKFDDTVLAKYKYSRGVILDVKNDTHSYSRVTGLVSLDKTSSDSPENDLFLDELLNKVVDKLVQEYAKTYEINDLHPLHNWLLMQYLKGDYFKVHKDDLPDVVRTVSVIVYLNDSYTGGEIEFPEFNISFKPKVWDVLIFPSAFAYRHGVLPVSDGVRYSAVNWYTHGSVS